jgi:flavin prenyltransferase
MKPSNRKIIVAVTGASGSIYAKLLLSKLLDLENPPDEIAVVFSDTAKEVWEYEAGSKYSPGPHAKVFDNNSFYAPFASGSSQYDTMIICPSSMGTIGRIANGT